MSQSIRVLSQEPVTTWEPLLHIHYNIKLHVRNNTSHIVRTVLDHLSLVVRKPAFAYAKTKTQISFAVSAKLISAFVIATWIVQSLYYLNPKFQASRHLLWLYSLVCVRPGRKPRRPVFTQRGSFVKNKDAEQSAHLLNSAFVVSCLDGITFEPCHEKTLHVKTKVQISCAVTMQLISALVFDT